MNESASRMKEDVTYALFDLDPAAYYKEKYANVHAVGAAARESLAVRSTLIYQKAADLLAALRDCMSETGSRALKVLEVGCGSGTFGGRIKHAFPEVRLYGVDMSAACIELSRRNGFDEAVVCDAVQGLPYADETFDFIYTMDYFGHIEFRSKNAMIAELYRVTKPGGWGFHGIETGFIDYLGCNPKDPEDRIRKYVYMEGHIGVEPLEDIVARFEPYFDIVRAIPFPIHPLLNIANILNSRFWGEPFAAAFAEVDSPQSRLAADLVIGWINRRLTEQLRQMYGDRLIRSEVRSNPMTDAMLKGAGFSMTTLRKRIR